MLNPLEVVASYVRIVRGFSPTHNGVDLSCIVGTPVKARWSGKITKNGTNLPGKDFGNYTIVDYGNGLQGWYAHLSRFDRGLSEHVNQGDVIAFSGASGDTKGPHLHYSESKTNTLIWIDPNLTKGGDDMIDWHYLPDGSVFKYEDDPQVYWAVPSPEAYTKNIGSFDRVKVRNNPIKELKERIASLEATGAVALTPEEKQAIEVTKDVLNKFK
jgi:murein DD-endopeptidase MepM/ murein hydrolase activator NlpD